MSIFAGKMKKMAALQNQSQPKTEVTTEPHDIQKELQKIGDQKQVNPPPTEGMSTAPPDENPKPEKAEVLTLCPTCGKGFKHLSRHRCKVAGTPADQAGDIVDAARAGGAEEFQQAKQGGPDTFKVEPGTDKFDTSEKHNDLKSLQGEEDYKFDMIIGAELVQVSPQCDVNNIPFHILAGKLERRVKDALGQHWAELQYGKDKAALSEACEEILATDYLDGKTLIVAEKTSVYNIVCDLLRRHARRVFAATR